MFNISSIRSLRCLSNGALKNFSTSSTCQHIHLLTRLRVVDNSALGKQAMMDGKPPKVIHVYNKKGRAQLGDQVLLAIKGQKKKGFLVGAKHKVQEPLRPRFDTNNVVLMDDTGNPMGTRILAPIPSALRKKPEFQKFVAISTTFV